MNIQEEVAKQIRKIRLEKGVSQEKFASLCNLDRTYISSIERGNRNISIKVLERISIALNVKISELCNEY